MNEPDLVFQLSEEKARSIRRGMWQSFIVSATMILLMGLFILLAETTKLLVKVPIVILFPIWIAIPVFGFFSLQRLLMLLRTTRQVRLDAKGLLIKNRFGEKCVAYSDIDKMELLDEMDFEDRRFCRLALKGPFSQEIAFVTCDFFAAKEIVKLFEREPSLLEPVGPPVTYSIINRSWKKLGQLVFQPNGPTTIQKSGGAYFDSTNLDDGSDDRDGADDFNDDSDGLGGGVNQLLVRELDFVDEEKIDIDSPVIISGIEYLNALALEECRPMSLLLRNHRGRKLARIDNQLEDFSLLNRTLRILVDQAHGRTEASDPLDREVRLRQREKQSRSALIVGLVMLGLGLVALVWGGYDKWQYRQLQEHGVKTRGTVKRLYHPTHIAYRLEYEFQSEQGQTYSRDVLLKESAWRGLSVGDQLMVKYLPSNEASCVPGEADGEPSGWLLLLIGLSTLVPGILIYVGWKGIDLDRVGSRHFRLKRGELPEDKI